jgi:hypothetical protein
MTGSGANPRLLFSVAPADYVTERTRLAKLARTSGDKAGAAVIKSLKRPATAMWGVLAAGIDATAVHRVMEATIALADVQAGGGDGPAMAEVVGRRRAAVGSLVESAIAELARWDVEARQRREEIRDIVDQLARRADLATSWIDGTLRDLPEHAVGFDAFANHDVPPRLHIVTMPPAPPKPLAVRAPTPTLTTTATSTTTSTPVDELAVRREAARRATESPEMAARRQADIEREAREQAEVARLERELAERVARQIEQRANAQRLVDEAAGALSEVDGRLASAHAKMRTAIESLRAAEIDHAAAEQRHREAVELVESLGVEEAVGPDEPAR